MLWAGVAILVVGVLCSAFKGWVVWDIAHDLFNGGGAPTLVTRDEAHDHFKRTLAGSKWSVLRGYHVLRHSFISALASEGVDQRIIDEVVGHQSEEQRKRYRHLYPKVMKEAINRVFG